MVRRRGEGSGLSSCSYLGQYDAIQREDRRRESHEYRIQSGRSRRIEGSGVKPAVLLRLLSCDGAVCVGLRGEGSMAHDKVKRPSEGVLGKGLKRRDGRAAGSANFYGR